MRLFLRILFTITLTSNINLLISQEEIEKRLNSWKPKVYANIRGWEKIFIEHVEQAPKGCDLDFLVSVNNSGKVPV